MPSSIIQTSNSNSIVNFHFSKPIHPLTNTTVSAASTYHPAFRTMADNLHQQNYGQLSAQEDTGRPGFTASPYGLGMPATQPYSSLAISSTSQQLVLHQADVDRHAQHQPMQPRPIAVEPRGLNGPILPPHQQYIVLSYHLVHSVRTNDGLFELQILQHQFFPLQQQPLPPATHPYQYPVSWNVGCPRKWNH
jgi:hypothetical protein